MPQQRDTDTSVLQTGPAVGGPGMATDKMALALIAAICAGIGMRFAVRLPEGFWEDEIIAVTHAVQPLPWLFIEVARNDIHFPLYFLQLHFWSWAGHSDLWFVANSVAWGLTAMASLWFVARRIGGDAPAWTATAFLAVLPAGLWMSQEVRPYAWLSVLFIWTHALSVEIFDAPPTGKRRYGVLFLLCLMIIYSHAIGFFAVLFSALFAFGLLARRRAAPGEFLKCLLFYGLVAMASVPVLANDLLHDANLGDAVSTGDMLSWCSTVVTAGDPHDWTRLGGFLVYFGIVGAGLVIARTRLMTTCFLIAPLLVAVGLAVALKPIFKTNFFAAMMAPFMAIILAEISLAVRPRVRTAAVAVCLSGLLAMSVVGWANKKRSTDFLPAATDIIANMRPGDVVYAPQTSMFWGMAWYLAGPDWGSPLEVANPPGRQWRHVYAWLGPRLVDMLHLMPTTQSVSLPNGLILLIGNDSVPVAEQAKRVWLVTYGRADLPRGMPPNHLGSLGKKGEMRYTHLVVSFYNHTE